MNIVMITNCSRLDFPHQTLQSMFDNAVAYREHSVTVVIDGYGGMADCYQLDNFIGLEAIDHLIVNQNPCGASRSRNIGAASTPAYLRHQHVMFCDDDLYFCPGWDGAILDALDAAPSINGVSGIAISGAAHPYNIHTGHYSFTGVTMYSAGVLSTPHIVMPWWMWDAVGPWVEPGGPGGSEDVEWCKRAVGLGYGLAVTDPQCVLHCGLTSSSGKPIVGYDMLLEQNRKLVEFYGLKGVRFE